MRPRSASPTLLFFLAWRNLFESRLSLSLLVGAVAAGVAFQVPNTANQLGYEAELLSEGVAFGNGDVRVRPRTGATFPEAASLVGRIASQAGVRAVVPVLLLPGAVRRPQAGSPLFPAPVVGVEMARAPLPFRLIEGARLPAGDEQGVLVGRSLAERARVRVGDTVALRVFLAVGPALVDEDLGRYTMTVRGLVGGTFGAQESLFLDRGFLAKEADAPAGASMILVHTVDHTVAEAVAGRLAAALPEASVRAWRADSAYLASSIGASRAIGAVSQLMVVCAVAIPVLALLYINVLGRRRDIGILCAIGFGPRDIFVAFMVQSVLVGLAGCVLGGIGGRLLIQYFQAHPIFEWEGFVIRPVVSWECFLWPMGVVFAATVLAGVYPAVRAARTDPAPVFRGLV